MKKNSSNVLLIDSFTEKKGYNFKIEDVLFLMAASKFQGKLEAIKMLEPIDPKTLGKVLKEFEKDMAKIKIMFEEQGLGEIYEKFKNGEI